MGSQEIKVVCSELEKCSKDLRNISSDWSDVQKISLKVIYKSEGRSVESVKSCLKKTRNVSASMEMLINNTIRFVDMAKLKFKEADEVASQNWDSIAENGRI